MSLDRQERGKKRYTTDTQSFLWYLSDSSQLSQEAKKIFEGADRGEVKILVPIVVLFETFQKIWKKKIPFGHIDEILIRMNAINSKFEDDPPYEIVPLDLNVLEKRIELSQENIPNKEKVKDRDLQIVAIALVNENSINN